MTQKELASNIVVTRQTIVDIEDTRHSRTLELAFKIAKVFDSNIENVFVYIPS